MARSGDARVRTSATTHRETDALALPRVHSVVRLTARSSCCFADRSRLAPKEALRSMDADMPNAPQHSEQFPLRVDRSGNAHDWQQPASRSTIRPCRVRFAQAETTRSICSDRSFQVRSAITTSFLAMAYVLIRHATATRSRDDTSRRYTDCTCTILCEQPSNTTDGQTHAP
jgi:hypothetical protein